MKVIFLLVGLALSVGAEEIVAVAHPGEKIGDGGTVVWTPLFQAAWDELHKDLGKPVAVDPPNALMERLDGFEWKAEAVMPEGRWKVWAGPATRELIGRANGEAARLLGGGEGPFVVEPRAGGMVALGVLAREMSFKKAMHASLKVPMDFELADGSRSKVRFFGTRGDLSGGYDGVVRVLAYEKGTHAIEIASEGDDVVVVYLPEKGMSFQEACSTLRVWRSDRLKGEYGSLQDPSLHRGDDVRIPVLRLECVADFAGQLGSKRQFKEGLPWEVHKAEQRLEFELTEKGARVRAVVESDIAPFGDPEEPPRPPPVVPRDFHYDRPFFVFLWREGAEWPYVGAWVGDDAALERWK